MKNHIVGEAIRIEVEESTGRLFVVFEIKDPLYQLELKRSLINDIEYKIIDKFLIKEK